MDNQRRTPNGQQRPPWYRNPGTWIAIVIAIAIYLIYLGVFTNAQQGNQVHLTFTQFKAQVAKNNVKSITVQGDTIDGQAKKPVADTSHHTDKATSFQTHVPGFAGRDLERLLEQHHVNVSAQPQSNGSQWWSLLWAFGPVILLIIGFVWLMRRMQAAGGGGLGGGGMFGFGKSKARMYRADRPQTTFDDVAGIDEVKAEMEEIVDFLREPKRYERLGATVPKGVLLVGQPGTGKTLLARAVAGQARVPFLSANASEFVEMIVGVGSSRVRDLFRRAKEAAPAIIFIDEIDAIGRRRGGPMPLGGHNEQEQTLNQILAEMDGFEPSTGVIVIAATNRADVLDQALLRPGRFDRQVMVHPPDKQGRRRILQIHTRKVPLAPDVDLSRVAAGTPGLVGADLRNLVNEASLLAARHSHHQVMREDFDEALTKVVLGAERHLAMTEADRERIAYHEAGHALVGLLLPGADPVRKVSIVPRGRSLGSTFQSPVDERFNYPEEYVRGRITGALGGRAAERIVYEGVSTGAEDDLRVVTELARNMVTRWGMSPKLGPLDYRDPEDGRLVAQSSHGPDTARVIDAETKRIVEECFEVACELLSSHRDRLEGLARALIAEETLDEPEIRRIAGDPDGRFPRAS